MISGAPSKNPVVMSPALQFAVFGVGLLILVAISAGIAWVVADALKKVPEKNRKLDPKYVWLLLIPGFSLVWNFVVFHQVAASFKNHFESVGDTDAGDCGKALGLWYSISVVVMFIPLLNCFGMLAALVLLVLLLIKLTSLANRMPAS